MTRSSRRSLTQITRRNLTARRWATPVTSGWVFLWRETVFTPPRTQLEETLINSFFRAGRGIPHASARDGNQSNTRDRVVERPDRVICRPREPLEVGITAVPNPAMPRALRLRARIPPAPRLRRREIHSLDGYGVHRRFFPRVGFRPPIAATWRPSCMARDLFRDPVPRLPFVYTSELTLQPFSRAKS